MNYLIDEGMVTSKGSDAVISYLHHFFLRYGLGEVALQLHCDNCAGQNKNQYMLFFWRTIHGLHRNIELNFMVAGHTKFWVTKTEVPHDASPALMTWSV